jgi:hypothetical protein
MADIFYNGNSALPGVGSTHPYTAHEIQEYIKCSNDPVYFIKTYMKIIHADRGLIPFELYPFQEDMVRSFHDNRFTITMCSRQVGKSTAVIGYFLYYILFNVNVTVCISANKQKTAVDLLNRLKLAYENLPRFLKQGIERWARLEVELENGSVAFAASTSSSAVRGGSYNIVLCDEFAFVPEHMANEFYSSTFPAITSGKTTKIIMVSTPNGMNLFHQFWVDATEGRSDFHPITVHWSQVPGRDEAWKNTTMRNCGGPEKFAQEYDLSFLSTSYTLIRPHILQSMAHATPIANTVDGYREYIEPNPDNTYIMLIDTASGQGLDYSAFSIIDVTHMPYTTVATYANNSITTMAYPQVIMNYANHYNKPWILIEAMDIGRDVGFVLFRDYEYEKLITTAADARLGQRMTFGTGSDRHMGLRMTTGAKRSGCAVIKALIENQQFIVNDYRLVQQLSTFIHKGATYEAEVGHNDDLVMTLVLFGWASLQPNFAEISSTRALDAYITAIKTAAVTGDKIPITQNGEAPMPVGIINSYDSYTEDLLDADWLSR